MRYGNSIQSSPEPRQVRILGGLALCPMLPGWFFFWDLWSSKTWTAWTCWRAAKAFGTTCRSTHHATYKILFAHCFFTLASRVKRNLRNAWLRASRCRTLLFLLRFFKQGTKPPATTTIASSLLLWKEFQTYHWSDSHQKWDKCIFEKQWFQWFFRNAKMHSK